MKHIIETFIRITNAFDVDGALALFAQGAVIDDVSVGNKFVCSDGIRLYLEQFFVGYKTSSKLLSIETIDDLNAAARLDFTGDFGHEIGMLKVTINANRLIERIDADLE